MLERIRIVLVEPTGPANVGAVCRAMANMGLSDLAVVSPQCGLDHSDAIAYSSHARHVLEAARVADSITAALSGCVRSFALTARDGLYRRQAQVAPKDAARMALELAERGPVAFVFGRESRGLLNEELIELDHVVSIPADPAYPVLNLAAAVLLTCYELREAATDAASDAAAAAISDVRGGCDDVPLADNDRKAAMFRHLFEALERIDFFSEQSPEKLRFGLRHLLGRVDMTIHECDILTGMARQISWYVEHRTP
jgi:TrmH family RNA methyltransferase